MPMFLVETYAPRTPGGALAGIGERVRIAAAQLSPSGTAVRYVRTIYVPGDETCFHVLEGPSAEAIEQFGRRARLEFDRIAEAVEPAPSADESPS
jgi:hypothetical protein